MVGRWVVWRVLREVERMEVMRDGWRVDQRDEQLVDEKERRTEILSDGSLADLKEERRDLMKVKRLVDSMDDRKAALMV